MDNKDIKFERRDGEYISTGAKKYIQHVLKEMRIAYVVLAIAGIIGVYAVTHRIDEHLRRDINNIVAASCPQNIKNVGRFNDFVNTQIQNYEELYELNKQKGLNRRANLALRAIKRLEDDKLPVPKLSDCRKPILK